MTSQSASSPDLDREAPTLRDSLVLFMDLLGTRGVRTGAGAEEHFRSVRRAVDAAHAACFPSEVRASVGSGARFPSQWFSDNLALGYELDDSSSSGTRLTELVVETAYLHIAFVESGLLARGGIARGLYQADGDFVYGPALERAVVLEHSRAIFPRTVLDEASTEIALNSLWDEEQSADDAYWRRHLCVGPDSVPFVDYLGVARDDPGAHDVDFLALLRVHRDLARTGLQTYDGVTSVEDKYRWLVGYHNYAVDRWTAHTEHDALRVRTLREVGEFKPFGPAG